MLSIEFEGANTRMSIIQSRLNKVSSSNSHPEGPGKIADSLYTAVVADSLDELGFYECAMGEYLRPVSSHCRFAGRAKTLQCMDLHYIPSDPYAKEIEAVDSILPGEVVVVGTARSVRNAPWGELLSTAALSRGATGAVIDGLVRDVKKIDELGFPVFAAGIKPVNSNGRGIVVDYNVPVQCGGIVVQPGDLIFADYDGIVCIPASIVSEALARAQEKVAREDSTREDLKAGAYLRDVFKKYGVL